MVRIFINGKQVAKEELKNIEIHSEVLNRILKEKLTKEKK